MTRIAREHIINSLLALLLVRRRRRRLRQRTHWVHPTIMNRSTNGGFNVLHNGLKDNPAKFFEFYRMSISSFDALLSQIEHEITKRDTVMRVSIAAEEKLAVTLRYLATGSSMRSLHQEFLLGRSTISSIVRDTCKALWETLKDEYMKHPTLEEWEAISDDFEKKINFPHCLGAIDGKYIKVLKTPENAKSKHKSVFLSVLLAVVDSNYCFRCIDIAHDHEGNSNILKTTQLGKDIYKKLLNLPQPSYLPNDISGHKMPYVFVADEAFAICENIMRPFPERKLLPEQNVYNQRLGKACEFARKGFGLLANKWQILQRPIDVGTDMVDYIIRTCCVLHNYVRYHDGYILEDTLSCRLESISSIGTKGSNVGIITRDCFKAYFSSPSGSMTEQNQFCSIAGQNIYL